MKRPEFWHETPRQSMIKLHDIISACRNDIAVMSGRNEFVGVLDDEFIKNVDALHREAHMLYEKR